ncbi:MAG: hypothetical protein IPO21_06820 [Bacteroidales bacterium]|nr:hypothetical protein [Bacteroidales bacterium]
MKANSFLTIVFFLTTCLLNAQTLDDALRLTNESIEGNAQFVGTAGSMGAIGGNVSAIYSNPAGLAVFDKGLVEFSLAGYSYKSNSEYLEQQTNVRRLKNSIPNFGVVAKIYENEEKPISRVNLAFSINRTNTFDRKVIFNKDESPTSITEDMLDEYLFGSPSKNYSDLAWSTYIIDTNQFGDYVTPFDFFDENGVNIRQFGEEQTRKIIHDGYKRKISFSLGTEFYKKILLGISFNIDKLHFKSETIHTELGNSNTIYDFNKLEYIEEYEISGEGGSASIGILIKPIKGLSFGGAFHTPTFYNLYDKVDYTLNSSFNTPDANDNYEYSATETDEYSYYYISPAKLTANLGFIFKNIGFINIDYDKKFVNKTEYIDNNDSEYISEVNQLIGENYKSTSTIRVGGELRFGPIAIRGGYAISDNPYLNSGTSFSPYKTSVSTGIGVKGKHLYFDMSYLFNKYKVENSYYLYTTNNGTQYNDKVLSDISGTYSEKSSSLVFTLGYKF